MSKINELASQLTNDPLIDVLTDLLYEAAIRVLSTYVFLLMSFFGLFQADSSRKEAEKTCLFPTFYDPAGFSWIDCHDTANSVVSFLLTLPPLATVILKRRPKTTEDEDAGDEGCGGYLGYPF